MPRRFTSVALLSLGVMINACSNMPAPVPAKDSAIETVSADAALQDGRVELAIPPVALPPLKEGSEERFERALGMLKEGQLEVAERLFREVAESQPELAGAWVNLGHVFRAREMHGEALEAFSKALTANPHNCDAHNALGVQARREGRFADAEEHYLQCLAAYPDYAPARLNLGILYELYMGRLSEALAAYNTYQYARTEPDVKVNGWVMDLERRVAAIAKR